MSDSIETSVSVTNTLAHIIVTNNVSGNVVVTPLDSPEIVISLAQVGMQGPPGPGSALEDDFIVDGGNF